MSKLKPKQDFADPTRGPVFSVRFVICLVMIVVGIAWIAYYYSVVRADPTFVPTPGHPTDSVGGPKFMQDLGRWNYTIGFGLILLGLALSAHPSTPLGRGRGVVVGMLGCFLIGLVWICTFYVISNNIDKFPVFNDLDQYNLLVGIAFMAVGFSFATRWE